MGNNVFKRKAIAGKFVNLIDTVLPLSEIVIPLTEIESDLATVKNGGEVTFKDEGKIFLSFIANLEKFGGAAADGVELWFEKSEDDGATWNNVELSGFFKEFDAFNEGSITYATQVDIQYADRIRVKALSATGEVRLDTRVITGGSTQAGFILNVAKF